MVHYTVVAIFGRSRQQDGLYKDLGVREYRLTCVAYSPDETAIGGRVMQRQKAEK